MIGAVSIGWRTAAAPLMEHKLAGFLSASGFSVLMLGIPMLLATMLLAPFLLLFLRAQSALPSRAYYARAALAGVAFGFAASAGVGFFTGLLAPLLPSIDVTLWQRIVIAFGAPWLLMLGFGFASLLFVVQILVTGVLFGLVNGWLMRRAVAARAR